MPSAYQSQVIYKEMKQWQNEVKDLISSRSIKVGQVYNWKTKYQTAYEDTSIYDNVETISSLLRAAGFDMNDIGSNQLQIIAYP